MRILMTGATGYVGSRVAARLAEKGHMVVGLVRAADRTAALPVGVAPVEGDLADPVRIVALAHDADAVIHAGFPSHGAAWAQAVAVEARLILALRDALAGSGRTLIVSNGTGFYADAGGAFLTEDHEPPVEHPARIRLDAVAPARALPGARGIEIRLASFVHGYGGSVFLPALCAHARTTGRSLYIGDGENRVSAVHVDAAADAYVAALERGQAGAVYHVASDDAPTMRLLADAIAMASGATAVSVSREAAAAELDPFTAMFLAFDNGLSSRRARCELGWSPAGRPSLLWDVAFGSYARAA